MLVVSLLFKLTLLFETISQKLVQKVQLRCHKQLPSDPSFEHVVLCSFSKPVTYGTLHIQFQSKVFFT